MALAISIAAFIALAAAITVLGYRRYVAERLYESLELPGGSVPASETTANPDYYTITRAAEFVAGRLPPSAAKASALQVQLLAAGYRESNAVAVLYGLKLMAAAALSLLMLLLMVTSTAGMPMRIFGVLLGALVGFRLPEMILKNRVARRKKLIRKGLPDALDLVVVCAEAGLTIDRCFRNVSQQLDIVHPELCSEFRLFTAELGAGLRRKEALENLAGRTQESEMRKFVGVLTQADRFGTSMAEALRTHAEYLRVRRRQEAEEKASTVGVKLIFPIFFFILPCMFLVTVGPAAFAIAKQLGSAFGMKP